MEQGVFISKVYRQGAVAMADGVAQVILTPMLSEASFTKIKLDTPEITSGEVVLTGAVDRSDLFVCDQDDEFRVHIDSFDEPGKYYAVFSFDPMASYILSYEEAPKLSSDEVVLEGELIYNDKDDRIHFSPAKNRDDHRHHALDAIVIACTGQKVLTAMSTYNAHADDYERGAGSRPTFASPWEGFRDDVREAIESVLVKHKQSTKILNKVTKKITKDGRTHRSEGLAVRGKLHNQTFFGLRQSPQESFSSLHKRESIQNIESYSSLSRVADVTIRDLMISRLRDIGIDTTRKEYSIPKEAHAFVDEEGNYTIHLPNKRKGGAPIPVKKVRLCERSGSPIQIAGYNKWVKPENNEYLMVYTNYDNKIQYLCVPFFEEVNNKIRGVDGRKKRKDLKEVLLVLPVSYTHLRAHET